jgi:hypothetical protein
LISVSDGDEFASKCLGKQDGEGEKGREKERQTETEKNEKYLEAKLRNV